MRSLRVLAIAAMSIFSPAMAVADMVAGPDLARIVIIDGDTIALPGGERIRIQDIDAPETRKSRCEAELVLGLQAKARLAQLLRAGPVEVKRSGQDYFRRTLALVLVDGESVGTTLMREGLALPWKAGRKARAGRIAKWCAP
ncbi:thermonuclease family protein [Xanthobacter autotrophicus]|uniref:thermonuclease family protein n=1 Tax=Xanthobacter autotrophicus TaxID=280 RepID=UPI003727455A